ncbi:hypothetical protein QYM36_008888 [Artemia franciscana]|uniref:Glutamyl-tRNA(Gln) amidotransferase subunit C, mitochondrial n=1 Tax=Artemia franciscana TaxID=6661 RepID=A0AA88HYD6_ARTSF|nr:hypothetical protein QYM36_008888 [Artemia franciscana]
MISKGYEKFGHIYSRQFSTKAITVGRAAVPQKPVINEPRKQLIEEARKKVSIDQSTVEHLERLSLVDFANRRGVERLVEAIQFVQPIRFVPTEGVEPLVSVLEDRDLFLEADQVTDGNILEDILKNAALTEEDYFVAPPGNIPLEPKANYNQSNHRTEEKD